MLINSNRSFDSIKSLLFCPGDKPDLFSKAIKTDSDIIIFDWEDSVIPENKELARKEVFNLLKYTPNLIKRSALRINSIKNVSGLKDLLYIVDQEVLPKYIIVSKVESAEHIAIVNEVLYPSQSQFVIMIESSKGVCDIEQIIHPFRENIAAVLVGAMDLTSDLNCENSREALSYVNGKILATCSKFNIPVIDAPYFDIQDKTLFKEDTAYGKSLGFNARAAIHPDQIKTINKIFTPSENEIIQAKKIIETIRNGAGIVDGKMVDLASFKKANRIISKVEKK